MEDIFYHIALYTSDIDQINLLKVSKKVRRYAIRAYSDLYQRYENEIELHAQNGWLYQFHHFVMSRSYFDNFLKPFKLYQLAYLKGHKHLIRYMRKRFSISCVYSGDVFNMALQERDLEYIMQCSIPHDVNVPDDLLIELIQKKERDMICNLRQVEALKNKLAQVAYQNKEDMIYLMNIDKIFYVCFLVLAVRYKHMPVIQFLLKRSENSTKTRALPLKVAINELYYDAVPILIGYSVELARNAYKCNSADSKMYNIVYDIAVRNKVDFDDL